MNRWRTVDLVVAATIGVVFGVVFWAWGLVFAAVTVGGISPVSYLLTGVWLIPAVLAPLVVRRPGAGILAEVMAAIVSALLGSTWGLDTVVSGLVQGAGAEVVFALTAYRLWNPVTAVLAGVGAGIAEVIHDIALYWLEYPVSFQVGLVVFGILSGAAIAGLGSWWLYRALLPTGVLDAMASGRSAPEA